MPLSILKGSGIPDYEPDGDDGLVSCWKMVEHVNGVGDYLEDLKSIHLKNMMPSLLVRFSI